MAFVHQSDRLGNVDMTRKNSNPNVGPQTYDVDARVHKELMYALYPKKRAPFN